MSIFSLKEYFNQLSQIEWYGRHFLATQILTQRALLWREIALPADNIRSKVSVPIYCDNTPPPPPPPPKKKNRIIPCMHFGQNLLGPLQINFCQQFAKLSSFLRGLIMIKTIFARLNSAMVYVQVLLLGKLLTRTQNQEEKEVGGRRRRGR